MRQYMTIYNVRTMLSTSLGFFVYPANFSRVLSNCHYAVLSRTRVRYLTA